MLKAISRYGARVIPTTQQLSAELQRRGQLIQGPHIAEFEQAGLTMPVVVPFAPEEDRKASILRTVRTFPA